LYFLFDSARQLDWDSN